MLKLYLLTQDVNRTYDTYYAAVVAAESMDEAVDIHPSGWQEDWVGDNNEWCAKKDVKATLIGTAVSGIEKGIIATSFNRG